MIFECGMQRSVLIKLDRFSITWVIIPHSLNCGKRTEKKGNRSTITGRNIILKIIKNNMACRKKKVGGKRCIRRKKIVMRKGKRGYIAGPKSGWVRLKGRKKAPRIKRGGRKRS